MLGECSPQKCRQQSYSGSNNTSEMSAGRKQGLFLICQITSHTGQLEVLSGMPWLHCNLSVLTGMLFTVIMQSSTLFLCQNTLLFSKYFYSISSILLIFHSCSTQALKKVQNYLMFPFGMGGDIMECLSNMLDILVIQGPRNNWMQHLLQGQCALWSASLTTWGMSHNH